MSIVVKDLSYTYMPKTPYEKKALDKVNLTVEDGDFLAIIGHTGSGKSTFIQHLNALIRLTDGELTVDDICLHQKKPKPDLRKLRGIVGTVFQYPEYQLFAETVAEDVAFGPKNIGYQGAELEKAVKDAIEMCGLDFNAVADRSPFELSGGQKRRVAIAGVLAMKPKILVLDEPTAGLDPKGRDEIMELIKNLRSSFASTTIMVTHDMDLVGKYATKVALFKDGKLLLCNTPEVVFESAYISESGLTKPLSLQLKDILATKGVMLDGDCLEPKKVVNAIVDYLEKGGNNAF